MPKSLDPTKLYSRMHFKEADLVEKADKFQGKYRIKSTRLKDWDYSLEGAYFVTICTKDREHFLGEIAEGVITQTEQSKIARECWLDLPNHYPNCVLDVFVVMPNHVHGIIIIDNQINSVETGFKPVSTTNRVNCINKRYSLFEIIRGFKTFTARKINDLQNTQGKPFWQSRFYDHIVRDENDLIRIREYIVHNPIKWDADRNNPENLYM